MIKVLFVCLGNICRSPMGEGSFKHLVAKAGLSQQIAVDSAGTSSYHIGELPDERMRETAERYGIILDHKARQLSVEDFDTFHYIIAMDSKNYHNINLLAGKINASKPYKIFMMREFDTNRTSEDVPDPYFGGMDGFEEVYQIVMRSNEKLLEYIIKEQKLR